MSCAPQAVKRSIDWDLVLAHMQLVRNIAGNVLRTLPAHANVWHRDLCDAGLVGLLQASQRFDAEKGVKFSSFAKHRVHGAIFDWLRKTEHERAAMPLDHPDWDEEKQPVLRASEDDPNTNWIWKLVDKLPERHRRILRLYYIEGWSDAKIAEQLGVSKCNICVLRNRALARLRKWAGVKL